MNQVTTATAQVPATPTDPYAAYAQGAASGSVAFLKFVRGVYHFGADDEEMAIRTRLVPNMAELTCGFIKWADGKPEEHVMIRVADGEPPPKREDMGDTDETKWERGPNGELLDPWNATHTLPFRDPGTGAAYTCTTSSRGGIGALGKLASQWQWQSRKRPGKLPVVELNTSSYRHKTYGDVHVPSFPIVDWLSEGELMAGNTVSDVHEDLNDDIPWD